MSQLASIIQELKTNSGLTDDLIRVVIDSFLKAAFKKKFGTDDHAVVDINDEMSEVTLYAKKLIVEQPQDTIREISLEDARLLQPDCVVGDQLLEEVKPDEFSRTEILAASQKAHVLLQNFEGDTLFSEYNNKQGEIVIGYYVREQKNNVIVDLGKAEGILPKKFQSPRDSFGPGVRIKALIHEVKHRGSRVDIVLTRSHKDFVKKIFELEVPELYDRSIEIINIVREPGYRTKIAVHSTHSEIDPVGTCIGAKGVRINNVTLELDGERVDILKYDPEPLKYIYHSLSPAEVKQVIITDYAKRTAIAVVDEEDFSIAIGKLGLNIRLANRLTNWQINVKTVEQFKEMQSSDDFVKILPDTTVDSEEVDIDKVAELTALNTAVVSKLQDHNIIFIEDLLKQSDDDLKRYGLSNEDIQMVKVSLEDFVEDESGALTSSATKEATTDITDDAIQNQAAYDPEPETTQSDDDYNVDELSIEVLELDATIEEKLKQAGFSNLYDLVEKYSDSLLHTIDVLTEDEISLIESTIREKIQVEEE